MASDELRDSFLQADFLLLIVGLGYTCQLLGYAVEFESPGFGNLPFAIVCFIRNWHSRTISFEPGNERYLFKASGLFQPNCPIWSLQPGLKPRR